MNLPSATPPPLPPNPHPSNTHTNQQTSTPQPQTSSTPLIPLNSFTDLTPSDGTSALTSLLRTYTLALNAYHNYSLPLSQQLYNSLPPHLLNSAYVQKQLGLIHFELSNYSLSKLHLEASHNLSPNDVRGLEVLSTVYWHLKQDVELSYLARRVSERSPNKAESWIVVGNCFR